MPPVIKVDADIISEHRYVTCPRCGMRDIPSTTRYGATSRHLQVICYRCGTVEKKTEPIEYIKREVPDNWQQRVCLVMED